MADYDPLDQVKYHDSALEGIDREALDKTLNAGTVAAGTVAATVGSKHGKKYIQKQAVKRVDEKFGVKNWVDHKWKVITGAAAKEEAALEVARETIRQGAAEVGHTVSDEVLEESAHALVKEQAKDAAVEVAREKAAVAARKSAEKAALKAGQEITEEALEAAAKEAAEAVTRETVEVAGKKGIVAFVGSIPFVGGIITIATAGKEYFDEKRDMKRFEALSPDCCNDDNALHQANRDNFSDTAFDVFVKAPAGEFVPIVGDIAGAGEDIVEARNKLLDPNAVPAVLKVQDKIEAGEQVDPFADVMPAVIASLKVSHPEAAEHLREMAKIKHEGVNEICTQLTEEMVLNRNAKTPIFNDLDGLANRVNSMNVDNYLGLDPVQEMLHTGNRRADEVGLGNTYDPVQEMRDIGNNAFNNAERQDQVQGRLDGLPPEVLARVENIGAEVRASGYQYEIPPAVITTKPNGRER